MEPALQMSFPGTDMEIEIVLSMSRFRRRWLWLYFQRGVLFLWRFFARESHYPVFLPSLASVIGECLLKTTRVRSDVRKTVSREDHSPVEFLLIEEFATTILEFTNHRFVDYAVGAVGPIQTPLMSFWIV